MKLYIPQPRPNVVRRPHLIDRLDEGPRSGRKLTLISAPAGFGKTTLISEWVASCEQPAAWLSLDEGDNDLTRFLDYLVAALATVAPTISERMLGVLHSPQPPPTESILTILLNEVTTIPDHFALVLDDYHVIDAKPIDAAITFLLEHLPPQMHLVITTREDPNLPLARLRARGQLTDLRAADLRFTPDEAAEFLNHVMGLNLSAAEVDALEVRTEGWIAGLQLAALSMQGREDIHGFIQAFAGDHHYIVDYLVEEVLQRQPEHTREFLLRTCILDRLSGPLCDAVRFDRAETRNGHADGSVLLDALERGNLFVVRLDDKRQWYRYHHLFADVLRAHALQEQPDRVAILHRRASEWYEHHGFRADAIHHALAGTDFERAADLVELAWRPMDRSLESATWLRWAKALPDELVRTRPVLGMGYAWAYLNVGELEAGDARLRDAERWLEGASDARERAPRSAGEMVVVDEEEFRSLPATIASARAFHAQALGDMPGSMLYARRALDLFPEEDYLGRAIPAAILGLTYWANGDLEAAYQILADAMAGFERTGNIIAAITGTYVLAEIRMAQGRLREAIRTYERALQLTAEQNETVLRGTAELHLGVSELLREQNQLEAATQHLQRSEEVGEYAALPRWQYHRCLAQARIKEAEGDLEAALGLLDEAERHYIRGPVPDVRPIAALRARVWIAQGRLDDALEWAHKQDLSVGDDLSYLREFEYITLARVLIAQYTNGRVDDAIHEALLLLERLLKAAEAGERTGSAIEILAVQALAHHAHGDIPAALGSLEQALVLAEPEGYVRRFVDEGAPMAELLSEAAARGIAPDYTDRLLAAFLTDSATVTTRPKIADPKSQMVEPLSERELEVLHLIAEGLSNREIGARLFIALNTVKGHNRKIFGKLQVNRRTEAVARARELGLL